MDNKKLFRAQGFIGPFKTSISSVFFHKLANRFIKIIDEREKHPIYNRFSVRDWHLIDSEIVSLFKDKAVLDKLKSILGPDLVLWRTKIFDKAPGEGPIGWHQEWGKFNGEEIGNNIPALENPMNPKGYSNNITVWFALNDIDISMGPLRFARGTHTRRFPVEMVELTKSEFWQNPMILNKKPSQLIDMALEDSLILDIKTENLFNESEKNTLSREEVKKRIENAMRNFRGAKTVSFFEQEHDIVELEMKTGEFVIFTERTMHGSGANTSTNRRIGFNGRITTSSTLIYPFRLSNEFIDGSNLDINNHKCVLLNGKNHNRKNIFLKSD